MRSPLRGRAGTRAQVAWPRAVPLTTRQDPFPGQDAGRATAPDARTHAALTSVPSRCGGTSWSSCRDWGSWGPAASQFSASDCSRPRFQILGAFLLWPFSVCGAGTRHSQSTAPRARIHHVLRSAGSAWPGPPGYCWGLVGTALPL